MAPRDLDHRCVTGRLHRVTSALPRIRRGWILQVVGVATLCMGLVVPAGSTVAVPVGVAQASAPTATPPQGRLLVGDSLGVSVSDRLRAQAFRVDAQVGRQFSAAPAIVRAQGAQLPRNVVIELGTNGPIALADCRRIVRTAGRDRMVLLVTNRVPRSWERANRRTMRACDRAYAGPRVKVINWYRHSAGHPEWIAGDRVHLSPAGQRAFARFIDRSVDRMGLR
jgi:lysophospholipase L1-like esterase